jgi:glycosyltransferase involved in cell wall biosynthesis
MTTMNGTDAPRFVLFAPTLRSGGGYASLQGHLAPYLPRLTAALVSDAASLRAALPGMGGEVAEVSGHLDGIRRLRTYLRTGQATHVIAAQNPILPVAPIAVSIIQNHFLVKPFRAARLDPYPEEWLRLFGGAVLTALQVARSQETIVLNSAYPRWWGRRGCLRVVPNSLSESVICRPSAPRRRTIAVVSSFHRFRGLHLTIDAFRRSGLCASGWRMVVHASSGNVRYERICRQLVARTPAVDFGPEGPAIHTLATASIALFPSKLEGSSIAFLEALVLVPRLIAFDAPHFRESTSLGDTLAIVDWLPGWDAGAWAAKLLDVAASVRGARDDTI